MFNVLKKERPLTTLLIAISIHRSFGRLAVLSQNENQFVLLLSKMRICSCKAIVIFGHEIDFL